jgi:hypothetical protein
MKKVSFFFSDLEWDVMFSLSSSSFSRSRTTTKYTGTDLEAGWYGFGWCTQFLWVLRHDVLLHVENERRCVCLAQIIFRLFAFAFLLFFLLWFRFTFNYFCSLLFKCQVRIWKFHLLCRCPFSHNCTPRLRNTKHSLNHPLGLILCVCLENFTFNLYSFLLYIVWYFCLCYLSFCCFLLHYYYLLWSHS